MPVNASEFFTLTETERKTVVETVVEQTNGRVPVVAGVSGHRPRSRSRWLATLARPAPTR